MKVRCFILVGALLMVVPSVGQIEISPSLKEAIVKAVEKNSTVRNKNLEVEKIDLERKSVWHKYVPKIEASASYVYFDSKLTLDLPSQNLPIINQPVFSEASTFNNYGNLLVGSVMAKTVLFSGFQIENGAKALAEKRNATQYLSDAAKEVLIKDIINTFDQVYLLEAIEKLINDSEKRLTLETKRVEKAIQEGLAIPYERDKIKLAHLELQAKSLELEGKRKVLFQKLTYLTGYNENELKAVVCTLSPFVVSEDLSIENKQELKALESYKKASDFLIKKEKGSYLPTLGGFGGLTYTSLFDFTAKTQPLSIVNQPLYGSINELTLSPNWMVGVGMKWEIFSGFERKHKVHEAKIQALQIQNQLDDTKEKLALLLENNLSNYRVQNQKLQIMIAQEQLALTNLKMATSQYQEGLISISERLLAENDVIKASTNKIQTLIDQRLSGLEVMLGTGTLNQLLLN